MRSFVSVVLKTNNWAFTENESDLLGEKKWVAISERRIHNLTRSTGDATVWIASYEVGFCDAASLCRISGVRDETLT